MACYIITLVNITCKLENNVYPTSPYQDEDLRPLLKRDMAQVLPGEKDKDRLPSLLLVGMYWFTWNHK